MDFLEIVKRLTHEQVEFVIIGGFAATIYGCTLVTQDLDLCCNFSNENLQRLEKALAGLNPVHRMTPKRKKFALTEIDVKNLKNLYLDTDIGVLDCLSFVEGVGSFETVKAKSICIKTEGIEFYTLGLDALIESKEAMARERDRQAVIQLKSIRETQSS